MVYHPSSASNPTLKASYHHESLIFPLTSSITVTLQKPISQHPPRPHSSSFSSSSNEEDAMEDDDGYILISESDVSSWVVGMRVPYPFTHPRYDPNKISTISHKTPPGPYHLFSSSASAASATHRLPSFQPSSFLSSSTSASASASAGGGGGGGGASLEQLKEMREMGFSNFDYYRYSQAYDAFEKCATGQVTSATSAATGEGTSGAGAATCNLTEFIERERVKHFNQFKFYEELNSGGAAGHAALSPALESPTTIGLLVLAGIFGGIFVSLLLLLVVIFYLNSLNKTPLTRTEILKKFFVSLVTPSSASSLVDSSQLPPSSETDLTLSEQHQTSLAHPDRHPHRPHHHNLEIFHEEELGRGSNGTVVLRGLFEGRRHVAVKKMVARFHNFERFDVYPHPTLTPPSLVCAPERDLS
jgi:hypothetical protein